jgi:hypothetical protein
MRLPFTGKPLSLATSQWFVLVFVLFVGGPAVLFLTFTPELGQLIARHVSIPRLERQLGFTMGTVLVPSACDAPYEMMTFAHLDPASPLAKAGINEGDVPFVYHGAAELASRLDALEAGDTRIRVASGSSVAAGHPEYRWVTIEGPRHAPNS